MLHLPCCLFFDDDFGRNSVNFLVRIYPLRIMHKGPDVILDVEQSNTLCVRLRLDPPVYNYPHVDSNHFVLTNLTRSWNAVGNGVSFQCSTIRCIVLSST